MSAGPPCSNDGTPWKDASEGKHIGPPYFLVPSEISVMPMFHILVKQIAVGGLRSKDYFDRHGDLKRIRRLKYWSLDRFLVDKFKFSEPDAREFADFLCPILNFAPEKRPTAQQCLQHPWLNLSNLTRNEVKSESSVGKVNVAMNNLQIKVGK